MAVITPDPDGVTPVYSLSIAATTQSVGGGSRYIFGFPTNPEALDVQFTARTSAMPTLTAAYLEHFGPGIGTIRVSGNAGWRWGQSWDNHDPLVNADGTPSSSGINGMAQIKKLAQAFNEYLLGAAKNSNLRGDEMIFTNHNLGHTFYVAPDQNGLQLSQNKSSPLLVRFTLTLLILRDISTAITNQSSVAIAKLVSILNDAGQASGIASVSSQAKIAPRVARLQTLRQPARAYTVQAGDTTAKIAALYGIKESALLLANGITNKYKVSAGLALTVPT